MRREEGVFSGDRQATRDRIILASKADRHPDPLQPGEWPSVHMKCPGFERNRQISYSGGEALSRRFHPAKSSRVDWGEDAVLMFHLNAPDVTRAECVSTEGSRLRNEICRGHSGSGQMRPQIMLEELFLSYGQGLTILENNVSAPQLLAMHRWEASKLPVNLAVWSWLFCSTVIIHSCRV